MGMFPNMGQSPAASGFRMPKIRSKPLVVGARAGMPRKSGVGMPSLKMPSIRQLLAGGLK